MTNRIASVTRESGFEIRVDGTAITAFPGETVAAAMLAARHIVFRQDGRGVPRGLYCNMGTCCECMASVARPGSEAVRLRTCLVDALPGMEISTGART